MKELIEFVARQLVDSPDDVHVEEEEDEDGRIIVFLDVADDDMGKVIGKQGRIANAMRDLLKVSATRQDVRASLEIGD
jgi:predicted RNA-binding protein YlqC (UPF0109 family)